MISNIYYYLASILCTYIVFKITIDKSFVSIYDYPDDRKIHHEKILKIGGIVILFSSLLVLSIYRFLNGEFIFSMNLIESQIMLSTTFIVLGAIVDDIVTMDAKQKLFFQITAILIIINSGFILDFFDVYFINALITIAFLIITINSMNLIDGIDGLSSGLFLIFCLSVFCITFKLDILSSEYYIICSIFLGSVTSFFIFNFPPAKIFLGDTGSQLFGWILALSIVHLSSHFNDISQKIYLISFLSVPFYDVFYVMYLRFYMSKGVFFRRLGSIVKPDQNHIHHQLLKNNINVKKTLFILLLLYFLLSLLSLFPIYNNSFYLPSLFISLLIFISFRLFLERN